MYWLPARRYASGRLVSRSIMITADAELGEEWKLLVRSADARHDAPFYPEAPGPDSGAGASGIGQITRANPPRWSSSRPLPPRPLISYFAVLIVCSAPRVVSTVSRARSP